jgi:hypothetical protein
MQGIQGDWLPDTVAQPHEIYHRSRSIVDADKLAWGCLDVGDAEFEGPGLKAIDHGRGERYPWRMAGPGHSDLHRGRNLVSQIVDGGCR